MTDFDLIENEKGQLVLKRAGEDDAVDVRIRRAFPWSTPGKFISVRSSEGKEILMIEDPAALDAGKQKLIARWLDQQSFVPKILRVREVDVRFGDQLWKVETDRGPIEFRVQEREDVRFLHDGRFSIKDADGNVYGLTRLTDLDAQSRKAIEPLL